MNKQSPQPQKVNSPSAQRKTTLKWSSNGELSAIDMARILDKISNRELTECDLTQNPMNDKDSN